MVKCPECKERVYPGENYCEGCGKFLLGPVSYAKISERIKAEILDLLIVGLPVAILKILFNLHPLILVPVYAIIHAAYHILFITLSGRTVGMSAFRLRVITQGFDTLDLRTSAKRYGLGILSVLSVIGILYGITDEYRQMIHDLFTRSYVIRYRKR